MALRKLILEGGEDDNSGPKNTHSHKKIKKGSWEPVSRSSDKGAQKLRSARVRTMQCAKSATSPGGNPFTVVKLVRRNPGRKRKTKKVGKQWCEQSVSVLRLHRQVMIFMGHNQMKKRRDAMISHEKWLAPAWRWMVGGAFFRDVPEKLLTEDVSQKLTGLKPWTLIC